MFVVRSRVVKQNQVRRKSKRSIECECETFGMGDTVHRPMYTEGHLTFFQQIVADEILHELVVDGIKDEVCHSDECDGIAKRTEAYQCKPMCRKDCSFCHLLHMANASRAIGKLGRHTSGRSMDPIGSMTVDVVLCNPDTDARQNKRS
jgi:hypothetical protein